MRDIAQSVSKVADLEMDNYFKTLLSEKRDIQDQQQQHIPSPSPVKRVPTSAKQPPKLSSSLSPPRLRGLAPGRNYDPRRLDYGSAQKAAGSRSLKTLGGTLKSGKQHWRENSNGGGAQTEREGSRGAGAGSRSYLNEPVYQRLYDTQTIYNQRLEGKKLLRYREQTQEMREKPEISPQSRKMTSSQKLLPIYSEKRIQVVLSQKETKIEKMKDEQARKKLLQEGEVEKLMRHFGVGAGAGAGSPKKQMTQAQWELKVSKLVKVYTERQKRKEEERIRNQSGFSFKPELCSRSVKILEKVGTSHSRRKERRGRARWKSVSSARWTSESKNSSASQTAEHPTSSPRSTRTPCAWSTNGRRRWSRGRPQGSSCSLPCSARKLGGRGRVMCQGAAEVAGAHSRGDSPGEDRGGEAGARPNYRTESERGAERRGRQT